ncbi:MAG: hypothetical protein HC837_10925 [Chloroflexaceae bacterium]|nr:hypothetical protein [Chloroflexaceae bacterium]
MIQHESEAHTDQSAMSVSQPADAHDTDTNRSVGPLIPSTTGSLSGTVATAAHTGTIARQRSTLIVQGQPATPYAAAEIGQVYTYRLDSTPTITTTSAITVTSTRDSAVLTSVTTREAAWNTNLLFAIVALVVAIASFGALLFLYDRR